ncbi:hypothetical protein RFI_25062 [Reticulomyxa filosa]|uniref:Uncharacterized protein n=1 Tax=Reticulomyxa filosa TaxID=46433 RepID=X6MEI2_RETFI|nr:hypothetical protein RFI_25062 [Reticulomyxa filosa]|eukprot:ETO12314.1 hypothetical protein RFI_25062 [Reticulomyxa filosa]
MEWQGYASIALVAVQVGVQPLLTIQYLSVYANKTVVVIIQELVKIVGGIITLTLANQWNEIAKIWNFRESLELAFFPSLIYSIQNVLAFVAYDHLDPLTFNLINQTKIISAAVFLYLLLKRKQTQRQLLSLVIVFFVAVMLSIDTEAHKGQSKTSQQTNSSTGSTFKKNEEFGLSAVLAASLFSGLAGTLVQKALQQSASTNNSGRNSLFYTIEMGFYGIVLMVLRLCFEMYLHILDGKKIIEKGVFHDLNWTCLVPITSNAVGGIGVGMLTKYAGVINKSYAMILGIMITGILRCLFWEEPMTVAMIAGVPMVMLSIYLNIQGSAETKSKEKTS